MRGERPLLTVDLDETVWPCMPVIRRAEGRLYAWLADRAPRIAERSDIESLRGERMALGYARPDLLHDVTALRLEVLGQLMDAYGYPRGWADEAMEVFLDERNRVEPFEDVAPVLGRLALDYCLVSVTNGNADLARTPLAGYFDLALTAAQVGASKPAPDIFEAAMRYAGVGPERSVHVGDDPYLDVEAARALGMGTVWVNRGGALWPGDLVPPDATVNDFIQLGRWLAGMSRQGAA